MSATIYLFDDDADILLMCQIVLQRQGYEVYTSDTCESIVEKVTSVNAALVIMDNKIPPEGGIKAIQLLKNNPATSGIPVIFSSANLDVERLSHEAGADYHISKPFELSEFEDLVASIINRHAK
ncbi:MAG TPA: response regulator [Chitinophagaceae bacterium]|jgi:DNA-binding response OmpR family regulator|nr:response regulator [Chitinophagaceae bacterium]